MAILEIKDLVIDYGIIRAVKGINMEVNEGSIVAILGANGAGKTTTIRSVSGVVKVKSGRILFDGENITNKDPFKIAGLGIVQSPEGRLILNGLTVEENLLVGAYSLKTTTKTITDEQGLEVQIKETRNAKIKALLEEVYGYFPILKERKKQQASTLSGGEQQMLAIGRALMGNPRLLLLDEPSLGLAPLIVRDIFNIIKKIKEQGRTILIVEQNAFQTLKIADYAYILELGKIISQGSGETLLKDEGLVNAYLGSKH
ncbi:MAG: ABC transporter ATP-binding protein [Tenericutes bacterium GWC2_34_14]|nr:MAG: ABC transporter ATP-binding protein [Tenericutes bacterium GWA2_35_7]OHE29506.1 MAG: ABC transporter ATP-binding protein [Tenericutes bacterium GWC2_34_14]OHE34602.1 MAG: ABC transporter ATP-binding protein [Tenericutes bacterium GWE2_34_108]OHE35959.1 MAG: ABC transporter ATP-binding protein [Tenericutes bacterium GWF1_35_14]OHE38955.1 MAG: ABC transporter ATP-binding protein [Tenericutes bacterium GWF2_35_184]OHE42978.1 MAG: ABC transporter ATP-binding protein [Tenericutes bacterium 